MGIGGGIALEKIREETREAVDEYYGGLNELEMGVRSKPPEIPDILATAQATQRLGALYSAGGIEDQPFIWLTQVWEALARQELHERLREASRNGNQGQ